MLIGFPAQVYTRASRVPNPGIQPNTAAAEARDSAVPLVPVPPRLGRALAAACGYTAAWLHPPFTEATVFLVIWAFALPLLAGMALLGALLA